MQGEHGCGSLSSEPPRVSVERAIFRLLQESAAASVGDDCLALILDGVMSRRYKNSQTLKDRDGEPVPGTREALLIGQGEDGNLLAWIETSVIRRDLLVHTLHCRTNVYVLFRLKPLDSRIYYPAPRYVVLPMRNSLLLPNSGVDETFVLQESHPFGGVRKLVFRKSSMVLDGYGMHFFSEKQNNMITVRDGEVTLSTLARASDGTREGKECKRVDETGSNMDCDPSTSDEVTRFGWDSRCPCGGAFCLPRRSALHGDELFCVWACRSRNRMVMSVVGVLDGLGLREWFLPKLVYRWILLSIDDDMCHVYCETDEPASSTPTLYSRVKPTWCQGQIFVYNLFGTLFDHWVSETVYFQDACSFVAWKGELYIGRQSSIQVVSAVDSPERFQCFSTKPCPAGDQAAPADRNTIETNPCVMA